MRVHISVYGTQNEIKDLVACLFIYKDDLVKDRTHGENKVLRVGEWQASQHWYLSTRHYTTKLIETIRAFCFLHSHVAYQITNVDGFSMESNWKNQEQLHNMHYLAQELSMQDVLLRLRQVLTCIDSIIDNLKHADFPLAYAGNVIRVIVGNDTEEQYTLESLLSYAELEETCINAFFVNVKRDWQKVPELMAVKAIQQMCRESLKR